MAEADTSTWGWRASRRIVSIRFRVPTMRLARMRAFLAAVQRPAATDSPARWNTTSMSAKASGGGGSRCGSQAKTCTSLPNLALAAAASRDKTTGRSSRERSFFPTKPVAPVTNARIISDLGGGLNVLAGPTRATASSSIRLKRAEKSAAQTPCPYCTNRQHPGNCGGYELRLCRRTDCQSVLRKGLAAIGSSQTRHFQKDGKSE